MRSAHLALEWSESFGRLGKSQAARCSGTKGGIGGDPKMTIILT